MISYRLAAVVVESVDTGDLKSPGSDTVRVRVPSTAPRKRSLLSTRQKRPFSNEARFQRMKKRSRASPYEVPSTAHEWLGALRFMFAKQTLYASASEYFISHSDASLKNRMCCEILNKKGAM